MKPVLIQDQTATKIVYNGVEYQSLYKFAVKHKFYDTAKRKLLLKFIWGNFKDIRKDNVYNLDLVDDYRKAKLRTYLQGKRCKKHLATQIIYKDILYPSIFALTNNTNLSKIEVLRAISKDKKYKKGIKLLQLSEETEKLIEEKIKLKSEGKRRDHTRIKYSNEYKDYTFNSVNELARKIKVGKETIKSFIHKHNIKPINYEIDLNDKKYILLKNYIEQKDKEKILIPFEEKIKEFAEYNDIPLCKVQALVKEKQIKKIKELEKYYQYRYTG